jgi:hypothetical protein
LIRPWTPKAARTVSSVLFVLRKFTNTDLVNTAAADDAAFDNV